MMKSAIEWLMGKSESLAINNDIGSTSISVGTENENSVGDKDSSKENSLLNGHYSGSTQNKNASLSIPVENSMRSPGEEIRSPWGRTLTPKSSKYASQPSPKSSSRHSSVAGSLRMSPPMSWEDMSFTSDVISPGFASRIAKEGRSGRKPYDGSRKYPIGQEKYIRAGILPNVRLKGHSKPVVMARRAPTSPLLPLSSSSSPFSSSSLASGFLASASTRMPDISSVVSVLDSTPSTSACETIKDPTSVRAVVEALEQAQNLKSGIKRSRYTEIEDSNKKQKCALNSSFDNINEFATPVATQSLSNNAVDVGGGGGGGGEKRALDLSPPSSSGGTPDKPQLSPENKRRCVPDPRIASFSSSKNFNNFIPNNNSSGRETPFSMYESHQDSDSESNKSMESHQSKQSERSYRGQSDLPSGRLSSQENFDHSGSQTPQSVKGGSYGLGASNGSSSSSRTTTPSKPSYIFSLEAYKADKAKNNQRLNKMLGMLFNVSDEENEGIISPVNQTPSNILSTIVSADTGVNVEKSENTVVSSSPINLLTTLSATPTSTGLLKEAFAKVQPEVPATSSDNEAKESEENDATDVSATFTFTLKPPKQNASSIPITENASDYNCSKTTLANDPVTNLSILPPSSEASGLSSSTAITAASVSVVSPAPCNGNTFTSFPSLFPKPPTSTVQKDPIQISSVANNTLPPSYKLPFISSSPPSYGSFAALTSTVNTVNAEDLSTVSQRSSVGQPVVSNENLNFSTSNQFALKGLNTSSNLPSTFSLTKPIQIENNKGSSNTTTTSSCNVISSTNFSNVSESSGIAKVSSIFNLGTDTVSSAAKMTSSNEANVPKSLLSFSQPFSAPSNSTSSVAPGLFSFAGSSTSPAFNASSKESNINAPSQSISSPFVFGASLPSSNSTSVTSAAPSISNASTSNIFNFGSKPLTTSSGNSLPSGITSLSSITPLSSITQPVSTNPLLSFNVSQAESTKSVSVTTTANSVFGSNTFTFAGNSFKPSVSNSSECIQPQSTTSVVFSFGGAPVSSPSIFSFANNPNNKSQTNSTSFPFGLTTTTHSIATPSFGASIGGGFSFGGAKTTSSTVPQFGAGSTITTTSSNSSTSSTFSFGSLASKPHTGFDFSTPKSEASTAPGTNIFTFGSNNAHSSPFGNSTTSPFGNTQSTNSGGIFSTSVAVPKTSLGFSFGNETPSTNLLNPQPPPSIFGAADMGNKATVKPLFGSNENTAASNFGSTNPVSPFGISQTTSPFNPKPPPPAYGFGASKTEAPSSGAAHVSSPPNPSPFQVNQNNSQNAPFTFGQSNSSAAVVAGSQIFQFGSGSQGTFGAGASTPFSFGAGNMSGQSGANIFTSGATSEAASGGRRIKAKAHRRRC